VISHFDLPEVNYVGMAGSDQVGADRKYSYFRCMVPMLHRVSSGL
jgi:hypothetical protein